MSNINSHSYGSRIQTQWCDQGRELSIRVRGAFDFDLVAEFRAAYEQEQKAARYSIDFSDCPTVTSAGLGMLLRLYDYIGKDRRMIRLTGINDYVSKVFSIAKFNQFFELDSSKTH